MLSYPSSQLMLVRYLTQKKVLQRTVIIALRDEVPQPVGFRTCHMLAACPGCCHQELKEDCRVTPLPTVEVHEAPL